MSKSEVHLIDCMEFLRSVPDKAYSLAVVDPPYGLQIDGQKLSNTNKNPKHNRKSHEFKGWDNSIPSAEYFIELFRVSQNQIIWGGNYFTEYLKPTKAWIFWYKGQNDLTMSDGEMAWTSLEKVTRQITINRAVLIKQNTIHPTEKPVALYDWIFRNYAKPNDTILDTHMGSQSSRISAYKAGLDFTGCELDPEYFEQGNERFRNFLLKSGTPDPTKAIQGQQINLF
jgi:site-specific DNA-methyltransferase (adenine-specific)